MGQSGFCATGGSRAGMGKHTAHTTRAVELAIPAIDGVTWAQPHAKETLLSISLQLRATKLWANMQAHWSLRYNHRTGEHRSKCGTHQIFGQLPKAVGAVQKKLCADKSLGKRRC